MTCVYFISDLHLGHTGIQRFRENYTDCVDMRNNLHSKWHGVVRKNDLVYILGDACFTLEALEALSTWTGKKILVCGNHDLDRDSRITMKVLCDHYTDVKAFVKYKEFWLSHCPVHPEELRGKHNIHGHTHKHVIQDDKYINVCVEQLNGVPISLDNIRKRIYNKENLT